MTLLELMTLISKANWELSFNQFCERAGFDPKTDYAVMKWEQFGALASGVNAFTASTLQQIITSPDTASSAPAPAGMCDNGAAEFRAEKQS